MTTWTAQDLKNYLFENEEADIRYSSVETHDWSAFYASDWKTRAKGFDQFKYPEPKDTEERFEGDLGYYDLLEILNKNYPVKIAGFGEAFLVEQFAGDGRGDAYWYVFKVKVIIKNHNDFDSIHWRYFKVDGHYSSYSGGTFDEMYEVFPKQVTVTQWEKS